MTTRTHARKPLLTVLLAAAATLLTLSIAVPTSLALSSFGLKNDITVIPCSGDLVLEQGTSINANGTSINANTDRGVADADESCTTDIGIAIRCGERPRADEACVRSRIHTLIEQLFGLSPSPQAS